MTKGFLCSLYCPNITSMARSNPAALEHDGSIQDWSEATLTEAQSGRYSSYSWSTEEGEYDRAAARRVGWMFHRLNGALYEGRGSGYQHTDEECCEWADTFPHFWVEGEHLYDSLEDGTEVVAPLDCPTLSSLYTDDEQDDTISDDECLVVIGRHIDPLPLSNTPEELREEVIAMDGVLEEYLAFDNSEYDRRHKRSCAAPSAPHRLPPVTPEACVRHTVFNQVMDVLWDEVVTLLQPLVIAARNKTMKEHTYSSRQSVQDSLATSHSTSPRGSQLLPGLGGQPPRSSAGNQPTSQFYHGKPSTSALTAPVLPQLPALSGVMQIKPVPLKQRLPAMSMMAPNEREDILSRLSIHHTQQQIAESAGLTQSRFTRHNLSLLQRTSDYPSPIRLNSRRHQLRPIDNPRTPALKRIEDTRIQGLKLPTNTSGLGSPPPTAGGTGGGGPMRNNQLPPLDVAPFDRSPPVVRGKSTFQKASSALTELQELRRLQLSSQRPVPELRPNTSSSILRGESGKTAKKLSDPGTRGGMKIIGHAPRVSYSSSTTGTAGVEQLGGNKGGTYTVGSIAEDVEETEEDDGVGLNITGYSSGFLKSKPRSLSDARGKHRGHGR